MQQISFNVQTCEPGMSEAIRRSHARARPSDLNVERLKVGPISAFAVTCNAKGDVPHY